MRYIHPDNALIKDFVREMSFGCKDAKEICANIFSWLDDQISYSRLNAPFFPLQRADLDVLAMKSGTCGDFTNLLVSLFTALDYDVKYAYVHRDCYGDFQDHICAAVKVDGDFILVDATMPYRKWHGYNCLHKDYELLTPDEFEERILTEEKYWTSKATEWGDVNLSGLLYAPWIHSEPMHNSDDCLDNVFFLLSLKDRYTPALYAYFQRYTKHRGRNLIMASVSEGRALIHFSINPCIGFWDDAQWSEGFDMDHIPEKYHTRELEQMYVVLEKVKEEINCILDRIPSLCSL